MRGDSRLSRSRDTHRSQVFSSPPLLHLSIFQTEAAASSSFSFFGVCMFVGVHTREGQGSTSGFVLRCCYSLPPHPDLVVELLRQALSLAWSSPNRIGWVASEPRDLLISASPLVITSCYYKRVLFPPFFFFNVTSKSLLKYSHACLYILWESLPWSFLFWVQQTVAAS